MERKRITLKIRDKELAGKLAKRAHPGTADKPNKVAKGKMYPIP
jgi:hypothetical protein